MDSVPQNTRARWKSLESVMQFGWCGNAVLGAIIAEKFKDCNWSSYTQTFAITFILQLGRTLSMLLLPLVPHQEKPREGETDPLREPLLPEENSSRPGQA